MISNTTNALKLPLEIDAWKLFNENDIEIIQLNLNEHEQIEEHINPVNVVFYVVNGSGTASIEGVKHHLHSGDCLPIKAGVSRGWKNDNNKQLKLLVIKH